MRRNSSYSSGCCALVFGSLAAVILAVAAGFAALGAWPVLPFAGMELAALGLAMRHISRHADDFERVAVEGERVVLDIGEARRVRRVEFHRHWARLVVKETAPVFRIVLRSHGREVEVGRYLDEGGRRALASQLQSSIAGR
jgi:uncharacterized membrane protein